MTPRQWAVVLGVSCLFGASFLFMATGLEAFDPAVITTARICLGALTLAIFPAARKGVDRSELPTLILLAFIWLALPLTLFPIAQQWIDSSVAGMLNAGMPVIAAFISALLLRRLPPRLQMTGLLLGAAGIAIVSAPELEGGSNTALGTLLVIGAVCCYGVSINLVVPLQQKYGSLPVLWRIQMIAAVMTLPRGLWGLRGSEFQLVPALAILALGVGGTGLGYLGMGYLAGNVGATRGSLPTYLVPIVAISLGVIVRNESVHPLAIAGTVIVLAGAYIASRSPT